MKKILTILSLFAGISAMAQTVVYQKIKDIQTDWSGEYLIVREIDDENNIARVFNGSLDELDVKGNFFDVSNPYDKNDVRYIASTTEIDAATFTIAKSAGTEGAYTIKSKSGIWIGFEKTVDIETGTPPDPGMKESSEMPLDNKIEANYDEENKLNINIVSKNGYHLRYNNDAGKERFRFHAEGKKKSVKLYKKVTVDNSTLTSVKVITLNEAADAVLYDLMGRRVTEPKRGIYVMNGAKVVVK